MKVFTVNTNVDSIELRGASLPIGVFTSFTDAFYASRRIDAYDEDGTIRVADTENPKSTQWLNFYDYQTRIVEELNNSPEKKIASKELRKRNPHAHNTVMDKILYESYVKSYPAILTPAKSIKSLYALAEDTRTHLGGDSYGVRRVVRGWFEDLDTAITRMDENWFVVKVTTNQLASSHADFLSHVVNDGIINGRVSTVAVRSKTDAELMAILES